MTHIPRAPVPAGTGKKSHSICRVDSLRGHTLIELLIALAILGLLASVAVPMAELAVLRKKEMELRHTLNTVRQAVDAYKRASDEGRIAKPAGTSGYPHDLDVLVTGVPDQRSPSHAKIYFLRSAPHDPLLAGQPAGQQEWGKRSYASDADAPQEGDDVYDIYSLATGTGLNGIAYRKW